MHVQITDLNTNGALYLILTQNNMAAPGELGYQVMQQQSFLSLSSSKAHSPPDDDAQATHLNIPTDF
jgi:hypothetical protein